MNKFHKQIKYLSFYFNKRSENTHFMTKDQIAKQLQKDQQHEIIAKTTLFSHDYFNLKGKTLDLSPEYLQKPKVTNIITGYNNKGLEINRVFYPGNIILTKDQIFMFGNKSFENLRKNDFEFLRFLADSVDYVLVSCGLN